MKFSTILSEGVDRELQALENGGRGFQHVGATSNNL